MVILRLWLAVLILLVSPSIICAQQQIYSGLSIYKAFAKTTIFPYANKNGKTYYLTAGHCFEGPDVLFLEYIIDVRRLKLVARSLDARYPEKDIAIFSGAEFKNGFIPPVFSLRDPRVGEAIKIHGYNFQENKIEETDAVVIAPSTENKNIFILMPAQPHGKSGSPVFGEDGKLIGMIVRSSFLSNTSIAIKSHYIVDFIKKKAE